MKFLVALCMVLAMATASSAQQHTPPEIIFINGDIYTGSNMLAYMSVVAGPGARKAMEGKRAQAFAVSGGKIIAVGTNYEIQKLKGPKTQVIDLQNHFVMPGFNDAHTHLASAGFETLTVGLLGGTSLQEMLQRIADHAKNAAPDEWLQGGGWDNTLWANQTLPTRQDIDSVTGNHPALFSLVDGHMSIANTVALKAAGITMQTPDPHGGKIDHDGQGNLTGILRETVRESVTAKIPPPAP